ncbi:hypothetical protein MPTK1_6g07150 [Marchantia polymorpha subsp. ruderalis]|uniref:Uncharacterized protein n=2 Tax=Marchantia polymorpha TaxID=3197 RepID=A0A176VT36_MARPO|nr:hypothetical protein AXG93_333s1120 [Marchantia polymorpha subsp. ruderalis]PTQ38082.1 hypothetical protein MARPO_0053s0029 [Marchantia polymorpha]BBN13881.1 hypothetical protein Mp_6g07150 [Marchantia polymorpha subsp. ruderalis]|eukprot:PTQ38082.1 hypothetical protein MARPO_0053s0029 [Marchantia polymorpha]
MAAVRRICAGGIQPVRVVHGDGQVLQLAPMVKVADVLSRYPHHYICHMSPDLPSNRSTMLPLDTELEPGYVYFLLPLPRLFPNPGTLTSSSCSCYSSHERSQQQDEQSSQKGGFSPLMIKQMIVRIGSPMRTPKKKVSPEISRQQSSSTAPQSTNPYSPNFGKENNPLLSPVYKHKRSNSSPKRSASPKNSKAAARSSRSCASEREAQATSCHRWKPRLGCISETDAFVAACEELRITLDRRRLTFESKGRPSPNPTTLRLGHEFSRSPSRMSTGDYCRSPSRELRSTPRDTYMSSPKHGMALAGYVFA